MTSKWTMPGLMVLLAGVAMGLYSNTLSVPFYLDDESSIISNPNFIDASVASLWQVYGLRVVGYISLWWDFQAAGLEPTRYHIVNMLIHTINGLLVFALSLQVFRLSNIQHKVEFDIRWLAFAVALIFITHPLHTQAVTYIVQRLASLVALFYLASVCAYIAFRQAERLAVRAGWFVVFAVATLLALLTKQNALTLFGLLLIIELLFFSTMTFKRLAVVAVGALALLGIFWLIMPQEMSSFAAKLDTLSRENQNFTRWQYFTAQLNVLWVYIGKVFWPYPLLLEYPYGIDSFSITQKTIAGLSHLLIIVLAIWAVRLSPAITFGVLFYYTAHLIESGVVPITDIAFEHRTYLPNVGLLIALVTVAALMLQRLPKYRAAVSSVLILSLVVCLSVLTWARNAQWNDQATFYAHELKHNPHSTRVLHAMAQVHYDNGDLVTALEYMDRIYNVAGDKLDGIMVNLHLAILIRQRNYQQAIILGQQLLEKALHPSARSAVHSNMGVIYANLQQFPQAAAQFKQAERYGVVPINGSVAYGYSLYVTNELAEASRVVEGILHRIPDHNQALQLRTMIQEKLN